MHESLETPDGCIVAYAQRLGLQDESRGGEGSSQPRGRQLTLTVMELEVAEQIGVGRIECTPERRTYFGSRRVQSRRRWCAFFGRLDINCGHPHA